MKIAICTPHYADVHAEYAYSLAKMVMRTIQARIVFNDKETVPQIEIFMMSLSGLAAMRNMLTDKALAWGANYILWADADHSFPEDALLRLLAHNLPVVGVNYPKRTYPTSPTVTDLDGFLLWTTEEMAKNGEVTQVQTLGLGFCLIDATVFGTLHARALAEGKENFWPLFAFEAVAGNMNGLGEDTYFFRQLAEAGIKVYVDHALSWSIEHIHRRKMTNADALSERNAYAEKWAHTAVTTSPAPPSSVGSG